MIFVNLTNEPTISFKTGLFPLIIVVLFYPNPLEPCCALCGIAYSPGKGLTSVSLVHCHWRGHHTDTTTVRCEKPSKPPPYILWRHCTWHTFLANIDPPGGLEALPYQNVCGRGLLAFSGAPMIMEASNWPMAELRVY